MSITDLSNNLDTLYLEESYDQSEHYLTDGRTIPTGNNYYSGLSSDFVGLRESYSFRDELSNNLSAGTAMDSHGLEPYGPNGPDSLGRFQTETGPITENLVGYPSHDDSQEQSELLSQDPGRKQQTNRQLVKGGLSSSFPSGQVAMPKSSGSKHRDGDKHRKKHDSTRHRYKAMDEENEEDIEPEFSRQGDKDRRKDAKEKDERKDRHTKHGKHGRREHREGEEKKDKKRGSHH